MSSKRVRGVGIHGTAALTLVVLASAALALLMEAYTASARLRGIVEILLVVVVFGEMAVWVRLRQWAAGRGTGDLGLPDAPRGNTRWDERA